jgi:hypothetical protein
MVKRSVGNRRPGIAVPEKDRLERDMPILALTQDQKSGKLQRQARQQQEDATANVE